MRTVSAVFFALVALVFAATCLWEIINPIFGISHHSAIHVAKYAFLVAVTALFAWLAFWWSRRLFEDAHVAGR